MKPWTDGVLQGAKHFQVSAAGLFHLWTHRSRSQLGRITVARKMAEDDALNFSRQQLFDHAGRCRIGKMTVARHDPLLHRPGPMRIILQKFFVVVGFDDEGMHFAQSFDQHFGGIPEIGDKTQAAITSMKGVADRLDGIMRDGKTLDQNIADSEFGTGAKDSPVFVLSQPEATNGFGRLRIAVNWNGKFPAKHLQSANMVAVLMSEQQSIELLRGDAALLKPDDDLARAQPAVDQNPAMIGGNESAIPGAAAAEHGQAEHG